MSDLIDRTDALMYLNSIRYVVFMCGSQHDALLVIKKAIKCIQDLPSAEPEIIRCKDCRHNGSFDTDCPIDWNGKEYCSFAER